MGGICQARVINHAENPARASALPSDSTPSAMAARIRDSRGRSRLAAASNALWRRPAAPGSAALAIAAAPWRRPAAPGSAALAIAAGSDRGMTHLGVGGHFDHAVTDCDDGLAVPDDDHRRTGACAFDDGPQHPLLGVRVQVRGRLIEQQ